MPNEELELYKSLFLSGDHRFIYENEGVIHERQKKALEILRDSETREFGYGGAAGGAKSWTGCAWEMFMALCYGGTRWFIGREELKRLRESTYQTFIKVGKRYNCRQGEEWRYNGQDHYIQFDNGSRIDLLDLKLLPSDPYYERYGSIEYTGGWIEEGGEVNFGAYDTLKSRVGRQLNEKYGILGKIFVTLNPKKNWCHQVFWKPFKSNTLPEKTKFLQALVQDNPFIDKGYIENLQGITDKVKKQRLLLGNFDYDDDENALMDYDSIVDLFTNEHVESGEKYITADVARFGGDKTVIILWFRWRAFKIHVLEKKKTTEVAAFIKELSIAYGIPMSRIVVDEDGVGGGVVDALGCKGFVNGGAPFIEPETKEKNSQAEKPNYLNLRSQCYFRFSDKVNRKKAYIVSDDYDQREIIIEELEQIKKKEADNDKKLQVVQKSDIKDAIGRSPDFADALMMREYFELKPPLKKQDLTKYF